MNDAKAKTAASIVRPEDWGDEAERLWKEEDALLEATGFEPEGTNDLLWTKGDVCYGREAALQSARRGRTAASPS